LNALIVSMQVAKPCYYKNKGFFKEHSPDKKMRRLTNSNHTDIFYNQ